MGGIFSPTQKPAQIISSTPREIQPFQENLIRAVASLFGNIPGITPLEEQVVRGGFQQAEPARRLLEYTVGGGFLPGTQAGQNNPFLNSLMGAIEQGGDVQRRQLMSAAQRAGALSGSDYLNLSSGLETGLAQKKNELLGGLYETERGRQTGAVDQLMQMLPALLGLAAYPRQQATQATLTPFDIGLNLLKSVGGANVVPGQTGPSPFGSLLSAAANFVPLFAGPYSIFH